MVLRNYNSFWEFAQNKSIFEAMLEDELWVALRDLEADIKKFESGY